MQYQHIKHQIQLRYGNKILFSKDCEQLSVDIFKITSIKISAQTLRRLFGFINDGVQISNSSINFLGFSTSLTISSGKSSSYPILPILSFTSSSGKSNSFSKYSSASS